MKKHIIVALVFLSSFQCNLYTVYRAQIELPKDRFITPNDNPTLQSIIDNFWYTEVAPLDETVRSFKRVILLGLNKQVIKLSFNREGHLIQHTIDYKVKYPGEIKYTKAWTITKKRSKKSNSCQLVKPTLMLMGLTLFVYALCKGPFYTQVKP